jgi:hypothetical protein
MHIQRASHARDARAKGRLGPTFGPIEEARFSPPPKNRFLREIFEVREEHFNVKLGFGGCRTTIISEVLHSYHLRLRFQNYKIVEVDNIFSSKEN